MSSTGWRNTRILSAGMNTNREEAVIALCALLAEPVMESMRRLKEGTYNEFVKANLPYSFRTGVIPRRVLWEREPEWKESDLEGLPEETISAFRALLNSGINRCFPCAVKQRHKPQESYRKTEKYDGERFLPCLCDWL